MTTEREPLKVNMKFPSGFVGFPRMITDFYCEDVISADALRPLTESHSFFIREMTEDNRSWVELFVEPKGD